MPAWIGKWAGGRIYRDRHGRKVHAIERMVDGQRYTVRLPHTVRDPEAELALFLRDPAGYRERNAQTGLAPDSDAVVLTLEEIQAFSAYQHGEHLADAYVKGCAGYLADWANALRGRDLRRVHDADLERLLRRTDGRGALAWAHGRNYRINALRSFLTWKRVEPNPARRLHVTKPPPSRTLARQAYTREEVARFYRVCPSQRIRDYYLIAAKTGMHGTEIARVAAGGARIEAVGQGGIAATVRFIHKTGGDHTVSVDAQTLAAIRRLMTYGSAPGTRIVSTWAHKVAALTGGLVLNHGQMRHSFFSWMRRGGRTIVLEGGGVPMGEIAALVNHRSLLMGKDHYDDGIPPMAVTGVELYHPEDPIEISAVSEPRNAAQ